MTKSQELNLVAKEQLLPSTFQIFWGDELGIYTEAWGLKAQYFFFHLKKDLHNTGILNNLFKTKIKVSMKQGYINETYMCEEKLENDQSIINL